MEENILLARDVTLFVCLLLLILLFHILLFVQPSKAQHNRFKCMFMEGHKDFIYGFIFLFFCFKSLVFFFFLAQKKKVKAKNFTWIASVLRLIYHHLLSLGSIPETKNIIIFAGSDSKIYVWYQLKAKGLTWACCGVRDNKWFHVHTNQLDANLKMIKRIHISISEHHRTLSLHFIW